MEEKYCITAIFKEDANYEGCYDVRFPGIEGVTTSGESMEDAKDSAISELESHFDDLSRRERHKLSTPTDLNAITLENDEQFVSISIIHEVDEDNDYERENEEREARGESKLKSKYEIEEDERLAEERREDRREVIGDIIDGVRENGDGIFDLFKRFKK